MSEPIVSILTFCAHPALSYGTLLVFKTLRVGFPTARIEVFDNGSHPDVAVQIQQACQDVSASFMPMSPKHYADHYNWLLLEREHGTSPLVLVDPDVIFWSSVEGWDFGDALMAGRFISEQRDSRTVSRPRLHPSMCWFPDVARLRAAVRQRRQAYQQWDAIGCDYEIRDGQIVFHDTLEPLYASFKDRCIALTESQLDCYDHLFYGSHLPLMAACGHEGFDAISDAHAAAARGELEQLRGIWRAQEHYFSNDHQTSRRSRIEGAVVSMNELCGEQGMPAVDDASGAMRGLSLRLTMPRKQTARSDHE